MIRARTNGRDSSRPCPSRRVQQWVVAFRQVNSDALADFDKRLLRRLGDLSDEDLGANGKELQALAADQWFCNIASLQFSRFQKPHAEAAHHDGGASCALVGLTLWGFRKIALLPPPSAEDPRELILSQKPGSVYMTSLVPVEHQVRYEQRMFDESMPGEDSLHSPELGEVGVHVILRTPLFTAGFGQGTRRLPNPVPVWEIFNETFREWQQLWDLRLPDIRHVISAPVEE